ncbi:MAG: helix-turn-helix domain-containing protein [Gemmatimonadaceae bacterium]|jgi:transcriptional regulator with XRE-family HTH domain|nr:helix-turn-helix domain-containing protein [Gemmatimonadaceae bacterium]
MAKARTDAPARTARLAHLSAAERAALVAVGRRIMMLRTSGTSLTIAALARQARVNSSFLGDVERGHANASVAVLARLALALDVPLHAFFVDAPTAPPTVAREAPSAE